ncbi:MAG TPA: sugar phosphate isomerase/epimerase [Pirellulales bacterium]|nr:sugar phosphate isomerase/epimerase [Pirellulales bacterium]
MFVAASTECFPDLTLHDALERLVDLEYSHVEVDLFEIGGHLPPSQVHANLEQAVRVCRDMHRLTPVSYYVDIQAEGPLYYEQFASCCKLAKATKVVTLTVRSGELGTPFNAEVERLRELVKIASLEGVVVGLKSEVGHMTQDPATAVVLCDNVKGLGITLDPSHYTFGPFAGVDYDNLFRYTCHTQLRDTSKSKLQVRVGQGEIEYGRLISQLARFKYNRALCVNIIDTKDPEIDHAVEMRKLRLLLESLL